MSSSKLKEKLAKAISDLQETNPNMFLSIEDILKIIKREIQYDYALQVLIPDFDEFVKICSRPVDSEQHESIVVMGIRNYDLDVLLKAIRKYIIDDSGKPVAREQYVKDLSELPWWGQRTEADRYRVGNIYKGRIYELILASWLDEQGDTITNMEAWDKMSPDIVTKKDGLIRNIQVKYIPQYKVEFEQDCQSSLSPRFGFINCASTAQNFASRIDSAATQLKGRNDGLPAVAIIFDNRSIGSYFINQENCCRGDKDVLEFQKSLYSRADIDEVRIYSNQGLKIKPVYYFDIKNKSFTRFTS